MTARLMALLASACLLAGCSGTAPADVLRADVAVLTAAANEGDADAVRRGAETLLVTVADQLEDEQLTAGRAERLTALAQSVRAGADVIDTDLLERQRAEAEAEQARQELADAERRLEQERARAEQAAQDAEERDDERGKSEEKKDDD